MNKQVKEGNESSLKPQRKRIKRAGCGCGKRRKKVSN